MIRKNIYILFILTTIFFIVSFKKVLFSNETIKNYALLTTEKKFIAGNPIRIFFSNKNNDLLPQLLLISSYSKISISPQKNDSTFFFDLPDFFYQKTGKVTWLLSQNDIPILKGEFEIIPNEKNPTIIENYLGPRTILAGGNDYTMMVTIPTDGFDNPHKDFTPVTIKNQFLDNIYSYNFFTENFIVWDKIYSPLKSGKMLTYSETLGVSSKEIETEVFPNIGTDFEISSKQNHNFADGNQITKLQTSVIKDSFDNVIGDGTMVEFYIKNQEGKLLKTFGNTINGIAKAQLLHPDHQEIFTIKAYIPEIAESNEITLFYKGIIDDYNYQFKNKNRKLIIGPLKSFMNQLIPDGIKVDVLVYKNNRLVKTITENCMKGKAVFNFPVEYYEPGEYYFIIKALGIQKHTDIISL